MTDIAQISELQQEVRRLQSIVMSLLKDKSSKDLSKIFCISEKEVREIKAILSGI
jgi:hypothetical protein